MNVGEYVRTKDGIIQKITDVFNTSMKIATDRGQRIYHYIDIVKSSPQIIDLIEEDDYIRIITDTDFRRIYNSYGKLVIYREEEIPIETFSNKFIGGIITHEQMEAMQYRVEE